MATPGLIAERYELGPCIGQGGMGTVSSAVDTTTGQAVAIKQLKRDTKFVDPSAVERFVREGEVLRRLDHPNIVKLLAVLEESEQHYLVMELVGRGSLESLLQKASPPLPIERVLSIALDLSDALARAHRLDIIHRDLKPSNVLIAEDGTPRLTDFGVAFILGRERLSASNAVVGTLDYLCPEALTGHDVDARADIWAFGAMLFEMLASRRPFAAGHAAATLHSILTAPPPDLEALRPDCPTALADLTYRMLEKDRNQRIPSARRVGAELERIIDGRNLPESVSRRKRDARFERQGESPSTAILHGQGPIGGAHSHTALATQGNVNPQLPVPPTPFVGREEELAKLAALLDDQAVRLVTIVGPGGMGKSRLALEAGLLCAEGRGAFQATSVRQSPLQRGVVWV
jgi:serine/threonine protein kinase